MSLKPISPNHDHALFNQLVHDHSEKINRLVCKFFSNRHDREDIVQEILLRVYKNLHLLNAAKNPSGWIYRIGRNICIDITRRRKSRLIFSSPEAGDPNDFINRFPATGKTPEEEVIDAERYEKLIRAIEKLPQKWKPFIYQRFVLAMTLEEISTANQMPINTVKSRIHRGIAHLRRALNETSHFK